MNITLSYPWWFILFCFLLGAAYAFILYFRDDRFKRAASGTNYWAYLLALLRFIAVSVIAFLLLSPLLKATFLEEEKPLIILAQDNSASIMTTMKPEDSARYMEDLADLRDKLANSFSVREYTFGNELQEDFDVRFDAKTTNIDQSLTELYNRHVNQNVGAVILASDGIYNVGSNPLYQTSMLDCPVYTIALGDTSLRKDLKIGRTYYNRIMYLDDRMQLKVDVEASFARGERSRLLLEHVRPGGIVSREEIPVSIDDDRFLRSYELLIQGEEPGIQHYRLRLTTLENEVSEANNVADIFIEVLDARQKILLLAAAPHPDVAAIRQTIDKNKNYELDIALAESFEGSVSSYNLVILHQLPSFRTPLGGLLTELEEENIPAFYIIGRQTNIELLNSSQDLLRINRRTNTAPNDVQAYMAPNFKLFTYSRELSQELEAYPPLKAVFGEYLLSPTASVMLRQKIGNVKTDYPLLCFSHTGERKTAILAGEGIWRWRFFDYLEDKTHESSEQWLMKTIQYLSVKADKRAFRTRLQKNIFSEQEPVIIDAELYNESYELVNEEEVSLVITDEEGQQYNYLFSRTEGAYTLNAGYFDVGSYSYLASVNYNGQEYTSTGIFQVSPLQLEDLQTTADHRLLYNLSERSGGAMYLPTEITSLIDEINRSADIKPVQHETSKTQALINLRWLFALILLLMSLEWFIRKWQGSY